MSIDFKGFAQDRSHKDVESVGEYGRMMVQFVAASNGFAATALLTLVGAFKSSHLAFYLGPSLFCYLAGIFYALRAAIAFFDAQDRFASMWEQKSYDGADHKAEAEALFSSAVAIKNKAFWSVKTGLNLFIARGIIAAGAMSLHFANDHGTRPATFSVDCSKPAMPKIELE